MKKHNLDKIEFKDEKHFLSNMYETEIVFKDKALEKQYPEFVFDNNIYVSSEHLYIALKSNDPNWHEYVRGIKKPKKLKTLSKKLLDNNESIFDGEYSFLIRKDWEDVKLKAMKLVLLLKFSQNEELLKKLKNIEYKIEERNCWGDTFWGTVDGEGYNYLGLLLEEVKKEL